MLVVGGNPMARAVAEALKRAGIGVRLWAGDADQQAAARAVGLDADRGRILVDAVTREAELEEVTEALLVTGSDDFNALAAAELRADLGHGRMFRVAPAPDGADLAAPPDEHGILVGEDLTFAEVSRRLAAGARIVEDTVSGTSERASGHGEIPLFVVTAGGALRVATGDEGPEARAGDTVIALTAPP